MTRNKSELCILVCPNAFKGSLTATVAAHAISAGLSDAFDPQLLCNTDIPQTLRVIEMPLADGGDGTMETLVTAMRGTTTQLRVHGPLGDLTVAAWGRLGSGRTDTAVIEMARASGLGLIATDRRDPENSSTYGTGELMLAACEAGCTRLIVGIGGSATNDGGAGMASALGARFLDRYGNDVPATARGLASLHSIDMSGWKLPSDVEIVVACDVDNPLTGPKGAASVYGPQKGADEAMICRLDAALGNYARVLKSTFGVDVDNRAGAGAAGGLGAGLLAFCKAKLLPGTQIILDAVGFDAALVSCDMVITGEGMLDAQTAYGKVIAVVAQKAKHAGKPCIAIVGSIGRDSEVLLRDLGLDAAFSLTEGPMSLEAAIEDASRLLIRAGRRIGCLVRAVRAR